MTTPLIEAIARAMWDAGELNLPERTRMKWPGATDGAKSRTWVMAEAALTAITEAGYAVVPVHPDLDTMLGMMNAANEADCGDLTITSARAALAYLISAAQGDGA